QACTDPRPVPRAKQKRRWSVVRLPLERLSGGPPALSPHERARSLLLLAVASLEAGDAAAGVQDLLLARVERVARAADLDVDLAGGRGAVGRERVAAGAGHLGDDVLGVDTGLHDAPWCDAAGSPRRTAGREPEGRRTIVPERGRAPDIARAPGPWARRTGTI